MRLLAFRALELVHHAVLDEAPHSARFPFARGSENKPAGHEAGIVLQIIMSGSRGGLVLRRGRGGGGGGRAFISATLRRPHPYGSVRGLSLELNIVMRS